MRKSHGFYADMNVDDLLAMRNEGMSNKEIAKHTGVCYQTILNMIGKQPSKYMVSPDFKMVCGSGSASTSVVEEPEEEETAHLQVVNKTIGLVGAVGNYEVDYDSEELTFSLSSEGHKTGISFANLGAFIDELTSIQRKLSGFEKKVELW